MAGRESQEVEVRVLYVIVCVLIKDDDQTESGTVKEIVYEALNREFSRMEKEYGIEQWPESFEVIGMEN